MKAILVCLLLATSASAQQLSTTDPGPGDWRHIAITYQAPPSRVQAAIYGTEYNRIDITSDLWAPLDKPDIVLWIDHAVTLHHWQNYQSVNVFAAEIVSQDILRQHFTYNGLDLYRPVTIIPEPCSALLGIVAVAIGVLANRRRR